MFTAMDIETAPNADMIPHLPEPDAKTGNIKDPDKIAAKIEEAKAAQVERMALDPMFGRIISVSFVCAEHRETRLVADMTDAAERDLLHWSLGVMALPEIRLVTWNGNGFDLPFLFKRCLCLGINPGHLGVAPLPAWTKRYDCERHIDLMKVFAGWGGGDYAKLDTVAGVVLGEKKDEIDVTKFAEMITTEEGREKIKTYNERDTALTFSLFERMQGVLFV